MKFELVDFCLNDKMSSLYLENILKFNSTYFISFQMNDVNSNPEDRPPQLLEGEKYQISI
jgi:hypothetical protein